MPKEISDSKDVARGPSIQVGPISKWLSFSQGRICSLEGTSSVQSHDASHVLLDNVMTLARVEKSSYLRWHSTEVTWALVSKVMCPSATQPAMAMAAGNLPEGLDMGEKGPRHVAETQAINGYEFATNSPKEVVI